MTTSRTITPSGKGMSVAGRYAEAGLGQQGQARADQAPWTAWPARVASGTRTDHMAPDPNARDGPDRGCSRRARSQRCRTRCGRPPRPRGGSPRGRRRCPPPGSARGGTPGSARRRSRAPLPAEVTPEHEAHEHAERTAPALWRRSIGTSERSRTWNRFMKVRASVAAPDRRSAAASILSSTLSKPLPYSLCSTSST